MFSIPHLLCGLLIGAACILPGLSGGALAASLGVYTPILKAINRLSSQPKESTRFLFPFALGGITGLFCFTLCLEQFLNRWPLFTQMIFLGLLMGGIPFMGNEIRKNLRGTREALICAALFLIVSGLILRFSLISGSLFVNGPLSLSVYVPAPSLGSALILFLTGFFSAATIVIPGISGSMLLMMLGLYKPLLASINKCLRALVSGSVFTFFHEGFLLLPLALGLFAGIFFFARLMETFLNRRPAMVQSAVLGLIFASPAPILARLPAECFTPKALPEAVFFFSISLAASLLFIGKKQDMVSS